MKINENIGAYTALMNTKKDDAPIALNPFVLTCGSFKPGEADLFYESILDTDRKTICKAELLYYRGRPEEARRSCQALEQSEDVRSTLALFLINALTSLSLGDLDKIFETYELLKGVRGFTDSYPDIKKTVDFFTLYFNIVIHNKDEIILPPVGVDAFAVQNELKPIAVYSFAHYLNLCGDYGRSVGIAEGALVLKSFSCPVSEIYLALIICVDYMSRGDFMRAEYYFRIAWDTAKPDGIIMPFVELRGLLSGMLEKCLRYDFPEDYKNIVDLCADFHKNWVKVHNSITGDTVSDKLTAIEFNIAMLVSKGLSNDEIATFFDISVNSVRAHLRNIFNKLGIDSRKEINKYVIK